MFRGKGDLERSKYSKSLHRGASLAVSATPLAYPDCVGCCAPPHPPVIDQDMALSLGLQERGKEWYLCAMAPPICVGEGKALEDAEPRQTDFPGAHCSE